MRRRDSAALLLAALPVARLAHAQPAVARIGLLSPTSAQANALRLDTLRTALAELGYVQGRNLVIEARFAEGRFERLPQLARELVALHVYLIVAINTPAALAAAQAGGAMPVLIASVGDPVAVLGERAVPARRAHHRHHQHGARLECQALATAARNVAVGAAAGGADQSG
jgi:putative ABC transport system substrate-binding protein